MHGLHGACCEQVASCMAHGGLGAACSAACCSATRYLQVARLRFTSWQASLQNFGTASNLSRRQRRSAAPAERGWRCAGGARRRTSAAPAGCFFVAAPCHLLFALRRGSARRAPIAPSYDTGVWQLAARTRSSSNGAACLGAGLGTCCCCLPRRHRGGGIDRCCRCTHRRCNGERRKTVPRGERGTRKRG